MAPSHAERTRHITMLRCACALLLIFSLTVFCAAANVTDGHTPAGMAPGAPAGSYPLSGFDAVNFFNGNLNFSLPLLKLGGRGEVGHTFQLKIERKWSTSVGPYNLYPRGGSWQALQAGYGAGALEGRIVGLPDDPCADGGQNTLLRLTFTAPDGTEYELHDTATGGSQGWTAYAGCVLQTTPNRGRVFVSADGSAATFVSDVVITDANGHGGAPSGYLLLRDGARFRVEAGKIAWARDRNGNRTSYAYAGELLTQVTDSMGRTVTISYHGQTQSYDQLTFSGFGGTARTLRVHFAPLETTLRSGYVKQTYRQLFPELNGASTSTYFNPDVVSSLELPDGRRYYFKYNSYGELARVELPTGGAFEYDFAAGLDGGAASGVMTTQSSQIYRRVVERRTYQDGASGSNYTNRMTVSRPESANGANLGYVVVEQRNASGALLTREEHYFHGSAVWSFGRDAYDYPRWRESREWQTNLFDVIAGAPMLRRVIQNTWQQPASGQQWPLVQPEADEDARPNNPQVTQTLTTLSDSNQVSKQTFSYDRYSNQTDAWEYDYGSGTPPAHPLRHTQTAFVTNANSQDYACDPATTCSNAQITSNVIHRRSLPQHSRVYAVNPSTGQETLAAHTETLYDESPLQWYGSLTGWDDPGAYRGNATKTRRWRNQPAPASYIETRAEYDQVGNIWKTIDARGNETTTQYSSLYAYALPTQVSSPAPAAPYGLGASLVTNTAYDFSTGSVTSVTDANGHVTSAEYGGALDRLTAVVRPQGGGRTDYQYGDAVGDLYLRVLTDLDAGRRLESKQYFDGLGRSVRSFSFDPQEQSAQWLTVDTQYDALGRAWRTSLPYRSSGPGSPVNPSGKWTESAFDALGRVTQVKTTADNAAVNTSYSGNLVTVSDPEGKARSSRTDALGRLSEVTEAPGVSGYGFVTAYKYDALDNLRKVEQGGQSRFFMYDSLSRLIRVKHPEQSDFAAAGDFPALTDVTSGTSNSQWSAGYTYDDDGNLSKRKDARNVTTAYGYDALSRNTTVAYAGETSTTTPAVARYYDNAAQSANGKGRPWKTETSGAAGSRTTVNSYDAAGRPTSESQQFYANGAWGASFNVERQYNLAGGVTWQQYPSGRAVNYAYDAAGRLADSGGQAAFRGTLGDGTARTYASEVRYHELGGMQQERFGTTTGVYNKSFYNVRGQLSEIRVSTHSLLAQAQETNWNRGAIINHYSNQTWAGSGTDNNGNLKKQDVYIPNDDQISGYWQRTQFFAYDPLNRLDMVSENGAQAWQQDYDYDRWGNRTINGANTSNGIPKPQFNVNTSNNRLAVPAGLVGRMDYDTAGNLVNDSYTSYGSTDGTPTRVYDAENRMASARDNSAQTSTYTYDGDGRRVRRNTGGQETWQAYGIDGELLAEYAAGASPASPQKEYAYRAGELLVTASSTAASSSNLSISNSGFEAPALGAGNFQYGPSGGSWTFANNSGISANASGFTAGNPSAPEGSQVAIIQTTGSLVQSVSGFEAGASYQVKFMAAQRGNCCGAGGQDFEVFIDNTSLGVFRPSGTGYAEMTTNSFNVTAGAHTLKFVGKNSSGGDNTAFLDNVRITTTASQGGGATYSATGDFSAAQNPSAVWSYGLRTSGGAGSFTPYTSNANIFGAGTDAWSQGGCCPLVVKNKTGATHTYPNAPSVVQPADVLNLHPGPNGEQSVVRWTAPSAGTYSITGRFEGIDNAWTTTDVSIVHNGATVLHSGQVNGYGNQSQFSVTRTVAAGDTIEFRVGVGSNGTYYQDSTGLAATITEQVAAATVANIQWMVSDQLGTPRMVVDSTGNLASVKRHDYLPFGEEIGAGTGGRTTVHGYSGFDGLRQGFTGYEKDVETGLDYAQARYYASPHGRFTSIDPLHASGSVANPQTWNRYAYALNSPHRFTDPTGMIALEMTSAMGQFARNSDTQNGGEGGGGALNGSNYSAGVAQQRQQKKSTVRVPPVLEEPVFYPIEAPNPIISAGLNAAARAFENPLCRAIFRNNDGLSRLNQLAKDNKILIQNVDLETDPVTRRIFRLIDHPLIGGVAVGDTIYLNPAATSTTGSLEGTFYKTFGFTHDEAIAAVMIHETAHVTGDFPPDGYATGAESVKNTLSVISKCFPHRRPGASPR